MKRWPDITYPVERGAERYETLKQLMPIAEEMRAVGVAVDQDRIAQHLVDGSARAKKFREMFLDISKLPAEALGDAGAGQTAAVRDYFWKTLKAPPVMFHRRTKLPQFNTPTLISYAEDFDDPTLKSAAAALYGLRAAKTALRFAGAYRAVALRHNNRIHFGFNPLGTKGTRWSASASWRWYEPEIQDWVEYSLNAQNIPSKEKLFKFPGDEKKTILAVSQRDIFVPDDGCVFMKCVAPQSRVLKTDLTWVAAGDLKEGDQLIAPEEYASGYRRRLIPATVTKLARARRPSLRITTTHGILECSTDHQWLGSRNNRKLAWHKASDLQVGDTLSYILRPWEQDKSYEAGWLAGFFDGEGSVTLAGGAVGYSQNPGPTADYAHAILHSKGFQTMTPTANASGCITAKVGGESFATMRFLGSVRPQRLLAKAEYTWLNKDMSSKLTPRPRILKIEALGEQDVVVMATSTKTFICEGFASHNCDYEALELRLIAYNSGSRLLLEWLDAGDAADPHIENARILFPNAGIPPGMTKSHPEYKTWRSKDGLALPLGFYRDMAKPCAYALTYQAPSQGRHGQDKYPQLFTQLKKFMPDLTEANIQLYAKRFFEAHTEIRAMQNEFIRQVKDEGRILLPQTGDMLWLPPNARGFNQAINFRHQSAGGSLINNALIEIRGKLGPLRANRSGVMLQVHDEVAGQIREDEIEHISKIIEEAMARPADFGAYNAGVPAEVDIGPNWGATGARKKYYAYPARRFT